MLFIAVTEGVALLLMQKGLGVFAARLAFKRAGIWAIITLAFQIVIYKKGEDRSFTASMIRSAAAVTSFVGSSVARPGPIHRQRVHAARLE